MADWQSLQYRGSLYAECLVTRSSILRRAKMKKKLVVVVVLMEEEEEEAEEEEEIGAVARCRRLERKLT